MRLSLGCESLKSLDSRVPKAPSSLREFSVTYIPQAGVDLSPSYYSSSFPAAMRDAYVKQWHQEHDPVPGKEPAPETITYNGNDYDDLRRICGSSLSRCDRANLSCRMPSSATMPRWLPFGQ
jgi:hypothetical protein